MIKKNQVGFFIRFRNGILIMLFATLICDCFTGCGEKKSPSKNTKYGGVLYFGVETPFHGFDVLGTNGMLIPSMATLNNLIQEPLFRMDKSGHLIPVLGLSASPSENGNAWDIKLRKGVFFHDGTPFNAEAVVYHWGRMLDPANNYRGRKLFQPVRKVQKIDDHTIRFILEHPWTPFLKVISDELYLSAFIPSPKAVREGTHDKKPVGTGPFQYHKWNSGDHFIVFKNRSYWEKGKPFLNKIVFRTVPDHQTRHASLLAGQLDAIFLDRGNLLQKAEKNASLYTHHNEGSGAEIVMINTLNPPLNDIRVRRALALANSQKLHIKMVYGNSIPFIHHSFGEWFKCMDDGYLEHDLEKAGQLIDEYGKPVEIECLHTNTSRGRQTGELLQQLFKKIGVKLKPIGLSTGPHIMKVMKKDYQLATWRILSSNDQGPQLYRSFHSQSLTNFTGYSNPAVDRLLEAQRIETDPDKREEILCQIARQINTDVPFLYRGGRRYHIVARKKIRDMMDISGIRMNLATAWIDEKVRFNAKAFEIEQKASVSFDCPDPGDVDAVKAVIIGTWKGKDNWGAAITATFKQDGTVTGHRTGSNEKTSKYVICGSKLMWGAGTARVTVSVAENRLSGHWDKAGYRGDFILTKKPSL